MKISQQALLNILCLCLFVVGATAQFSKNDLSRPGRSPDEQQKIAEHQQQRAVARQNKNLEQLKETKDLFKNEPVSLSREKKAVIRSTKKYAESLEKMLAAVPPEYEAEYAELLKNKKNHLIRLYVDKNCDILDDKVISAQESERCADVIPVAGGGSHYSFKEKTNFYFGSYHADIHLSDNKFIAGNKLADGIISEIGDVDFDSTNFDSESLKFLIESQPKKNLTEVKKFNVSLRKGIISRGFVYFNSVPVKLNSTYVLRSLAYKPVLKSIYKDKDEFSVVTIDVKGTIKDIFVVFKVVGQGKDGSLILLWKKLN
jgi:hypothetical protein